MLRLDPCGRLGPRPEVGVLQRSGVRVPRNRCALHRAIAVRSKELFAVRSTELLLCARDEILAL